MSKKNRIGSSQHLKPAQGFILTRFIALTLTFSLVLTAPGSVSWADSGSTASASATSDANANYQKQFSSQVAFEGANPASYKSLVNPQVGTSPTLQTAAALLKYAAEFAQLGSNAGLTSAQLAAKTYAMAATGVHDVTPTVLGNYVNTMGGVGGLDPSSVSAAAVQGAQKLLEGPDETGDSDDSDDNSNVGWGASESATPSTAANNTATAQPGSSEGEVQYKLPDNVVGVDVSINRLTAMINGTPASSGKSAEAGLQQINQAQIDAVLGLDVTSHVEFKQKNDEINLVKEQIKTLTDKLDADEKQLPIAQGNLKDALANLNGGLGNTAAYQQYSSQVSDLEDDIKKINSQLNTQDGLLAKRNKLAKQMLDLQKQYSLADQWIAYAKQQLAPAIQAGVHLDFDTYFKKGTEGARIPVSLAINARYMESKQHISNAGLLGASHSNAALFTAIGAVIVGVALLPVLAPALAVGSLVAIGGMAVGVGAGAAGGNVLGTWLDDNGRSSKNRETLAADANAPNMGGVQHSQIATYKELSQNWETANKQQQQFILDSIKNPASSVRFQYLAANVKNQVTALTVLNNLKKIQEGISSIKAGDPNWRSKLVDLVKGLGDPSLAAEAAKLSKGMNIDDAVKLINYEAARKVQSVSEANTATANQFKLYTNKTAEYDDQVKSTKGAFYDYVLGTSKDGNPTEDVQNRTGGLLGLATGENGATAEQQAIAQRTLRSMGANVFDQNTGVVADRNLAADYFGDQTPGHTYGDYSRGLHNSYGAVLDTIRAPITAMDAVLSNDPNAFHHFSSYSQGGGFAQILDAGYAGFEAGVGSIFGVATSTAKLVGGAISVGLGQQFGQQDWVNSGLAQIDNNLIVKGLYGTDSQLLQSYNGFDGHTNDWMLYQRYDLNGNQSLTGNQDLDNYLIQGRQHELNSGHWVENYVDLIGQLDVMKNASWTGADAIQSFKDGNIFTGIAELGKGITAAAGQTYLDMSSLGGMNSVINALPGTWAKGVLEYGLVKVPGYQFSFSVAHDLTNLFQSVTSGSFNNEEMGGSIVNLGGIFAGSAVTSSSAHAIEAATTNNVINWADATENFGKDILFNIPREAVKMTVQGLATLAAGPIGAVGSGLMVENIAQSYGANVQTQLLDKLDDFNMLTRQEVLDALPKPTLIESIAGARPFSANQVGKIMDDANQYTGAVGLIQQDVAASKPSVEGQTAPAPLSTEATDSFLAYAKDNLTQRGGKVYLSGRELDPELAKSDLVQRALSAQQADSDASGVIQLGLSPSGKTTESVADRETKIQNGLDPTYDDAIQAEAPTATKAAATGKVELAQEKLNTARLTKATDQIQTGLKELAQAKLDAKQSEVDQLMAKKSQLEENLGTLWNENASKKLTDDIEKQIADVDNQLLGKKIEQAQLAIEKAGVNKEATADLVKAKSALEAQQQEKKLTDAKAADSKLANDGTVAKDLSVKQVELEQARYNELILKANGESAEKIAEASSAVATLEKAVSNAKQVVALDTQLKETQTRIDSIQKSISDATDPIATSALESQKNANEALAQKTQEAIKAQQDGDVDKVAQLQKEMNQISQQEVQAQNRAKAVEAANKVIDSAAAKKDAITKLGDQIAKNQEALASTTDTAAKTNLAVEIKNAKEQIASLVSKPDAQVWSTQQSENNLRSINDQAAKLSLVSGRPAADIVNDALKAIDAHVANANSDKALADAQLNVEHVKDGMIATKTDVVKNGTTVTKADIADAEQALKQVETGRATTLKDEVAGKIAGVAAKAKDLASRAATSVVDGQVTPDFQAQITEETAALGDTLRDIASDPTKLADQLQNWANDLTKTLTDDLDTQLKLLDIGHLQGRGEFDQAAALASTVDLSKVGAEAIQRGKDLLKRSEAAAPAYKAYLFDLLKEGKSLQESGDTAAFQKWVERDPNVKAVMEEALKQNKDQNLFQKAKDYLDGLVGKRNMALTDSGFKDLWKRLFGDKTVDQAERALAIELNEKPSEYLNRIENQLWKTLKEAGVLKQGPDEVQGSLRDYIATAGNRGAFERMFGKDGKINEEQAALVDNARTRIQQEPNDRDRAALAILFAETSFRGVLGKEGAEGWELRGSQAAMLGLFGLGLNAAVEAGGGKTEVFVLDQGVHSILGGSLYRGEILVENSAAAGKYVTRESNLRLARAFGLKLVDGAEMQANHNTARLIEAFHDRDTVVVLDPTVRGHLMNEAVSDRTLRAALMESNVVGFDEVHLVATTRTKSIIGGDMKPPEIAQVRQVSRLFDELKTIIRPDAKVNEANAVKAVSLGEFRTEVDKMNADKREGFVLYDKQIVASDALIKRLELQGFKRSDIRSVADVLTTEDRQRGGYAKITDKQSGRMVIAPVNDYGRIEVDQISNDITYQIAAALKEGLDPMKAVRVQRTQMETGLASIFENPNVRKVGASATIDGLNDLLQGRVGARGVQVNTSRLDLMSLLGLDADKLSKGLGLGSIHAEWDLNTQILDVAKYMSDPERWQPEKENLVIATDNIQHMNQLEDYFTKQGRPVLRIDGATADSEVNRIAEKGAKEGQVILINPRAYVGVNFQMRGQLWVLGAEKIPEQEMVQLLKRLNRPGANNGGDAHWEASRHLVVTNADVLVRSLDFARERQTELQTIWSTQHGTDDASPVRLLKDVLSLNADQIKAGIEAGDTTLLRKAIELNSYAKQSSINSEAAKFAIQDALRDNLVIAPLKDALSRLPESSFQYQLIKSMLDTAINQGTRDYAPLSATDFASDRGREEFMRETINNVQREAQQNLDKIQSSARWQRLDPRTWGKSSSDLRSWLSDQTAALKDFSTASSPENYSNIRANYGLSLAEAKSATDLLSVVKATSQLVISGETASVPHESSAASQSQEVWEAVQKAVEHARQDALLKQPLTLNADVVRALPLNIRMSDIRLLAGSLSKLDVSQLQASDPRASVFAQLIASASDTKTLADTVTELAKDVHGKAQYGPSTWEKYVDAPTPFWQNVKTTLQNGLGTTVDYVHGLMNVTMPMGDAARTLEIKNLLTIAQGFGGASFSAQAAQRLDAVVKSVDGAKVVDPAIKAIQALNAQIQKLQQDKTVDHSQEIKTLTANRDRFQGIAATAARAPTAAIENGIGYTVIRTKDADGKTAIVLNVTKATAPAAIRASQLRAFSKQTGIALYIQEPSAKSEQRISAGLEQMAREANMESDSNAKVFVAQAGQKAILLGAKPDSDGLINLGMANPPVPGTGLQVLPRAKAFIARVWGGPSEDTPIALVKKAYDALEAMRSAQEALGAAPSIQEMRKAQAELKASQGQLNNQLSLLMLAAPHLNDAAQNDLMRLPTGMETPIKNLFQALTNASATHDPAQAVKAFEQYENETTKQGATAQALPPDAFFYTVQGAKIIENAAANLKAMLQSAPQLAFLSPALEEATLQVYGDDFTAYADYVVGLLHQQIYGNPDDLAHLNPSPEFIGMDDVQRSKIYMNYKDALGSIPLFRSSADFMQVLYDQVKTEEAKKQSGAGVPVLVLPDKLRRGATTPGLKRELIDIEERDSLTGKTGIPDGVLAVRQKDVTAHEQMFKDGKQQAMQAIATFHHQARDPFTSRAQVGVALGQVGTLAVGLLHLSGGLGILAQMAVSVGTQLLFPQKPGADSPTNQTKLQKAADVFLGKSFVIPNKAKLGVIAAGAAVALFVVGLPTGVLAAGGAIGLTLFKVSAAVRIIDFASGAMAYAYKGTPIAESSLTRDDSATASNGAKVIDMVPPPDKNPAGGGKVIAFPSARTSFISSKVASIAVIGVLGLTVGASILPGATIELAGASAVSSLPAILTWASGLVAALPVLLLISALGVLVVAYWPQVQTRLFSSPENVSPGQRLADVLSAA